MKQQAVLHYLHHLFGGNRRRRNWCGREHGINRIAAVTHAPTRRLFIRVDPTHIVGHRKRVVLALRARVHYLRRQQGHRLVNLHIDQIKVFRELLNGVVVLDLGRRDRLYEAPTLSVGAVDLR